MTAQYPITIKVTNRLFRLTGDIFLKSETVVCFILHALLKSCLIIFHLYTYEQLKRIPMDGLLTDLVRLQR